MEGFIFISSKISQTEKSINNIKDVINRLKGINHFFRVISRENITLIYYTNETKEFPYSLNNDYMFCPIGQYTINKLDLEKKMIYENDKTNRETVSKLAGTFLIANGNLRNKKIDIYTHITRIESGYIYDSSEIIIVGTDPVILSALTNKSNQPMFNSDNFTSFFELGYFGDETTPFRGVTALPPNTHITIENHTVIYQKIDNSYDNPMTLRLDKETNERLVSTLLNSFNILPELESVKIGLTGGKDSRLILLSLLEKGYNVNAFTNGFEDHPDVIIAKLLAKHHNISHEVKLPTFQAEETLEIDLYERLINTMITTSGQIFAYENIMELSHFRGHTTLSGVGGEILRGGYPLSGLYNQKRNKQGIVNKFYKYKDFYIDDDNNYRKFLHQFIDNEHNYFKNLHKHYLQYRTGRWASDSRYGKSYIANSYMPFTDNQLVKTILQLPPDDVYSGKLQYSLMKNLDEESANIRYANNRFLFENDAPENVYDFNNWYSRRPMYSTTEIGKYNWRELSNNNEELNNKFKNIILDNPNNKIFDNINYKKIEKLFEMPIESKHERFIWSLASMAAFVDHTTKVNIHNAYNSKIFVDLPSDTIDEITPEKEIIDLKEHFIPMNDSLEIYNDIKGFLNIKTNLLSKKNRYLQSFTGPFGHPPNQSISKLIRDSKTIKVNISMKKSSNIKYLYINLYSNGEQYKKMKFAPETLENTSNFNVILELEDEIDEFRIAVNFANETKEHIYKIYYAFAEIIY